MSDLPLALLLSTERALLDFLVWGFVLERAAISKG